MNVTDVLDVLERLHNAAGHPDIAQVDRYGTTTPGIAITYQSGAKAFLWSAPAAPPPESAPQPVAMPGDLGEYKFRALHALRFTLDLLEAAKPQGLTAWRTVAFDGVALQPAGLEIRTGARSVFLRVTSASPPGPDSDPRDWAGYRIPEGIG